MSDDVTVTLTRAEYHALIGRLERVEVGGSASRPRIYPTLVTADYHAALDKLEQAGRRPLSAA